MNPHSQHSSPGNLDELGQSNTLVSKTSSKDCDRRSAISLSHTQENDPCSNANPFRQPITAPPTGTSSQHDSLNASHMSGSQRRPSHLVDLSRCSTLSPSGCEGTYQTEDLSSSNTANATSPTPVDTAQDYMDPSTKKQGTIAVNVGSVGTWDEKHELQASPVQQQHPSLPFHHGADIDVAEMSGDMPYDNLNMEAEIPHLVAINTKEYERYKRGYSYPPTFYEEGCPTIDPLTTSFDAPLPPEGWKVFLHPEGTRYFYCDDPTYPVPVLTEAWIYDEEIYAQIYEYMGRIFLYMHNHGISFRQSTPSQCVSPPPAKKRRSRTGSPHFPCNKFADPFEDTYPQRLAPIVLVLDVRLTGNMGYYFVSHPTQTLFWLDPFDYSFAVGEVRIDHPRSLIGLEMKCHYWTHNDLFPHLYELEERDIDEVDDMIGFALGDALTSTSGVVTIYNPDELKQLQSIVHRYELKRWQKRRKSVGERRMICRVISDFYHQRFLNLYGERGARLNYSQSIHYSPHRRQKYVRDEDEKPVEADPPVDKSVKEMHRNSLRMDILSLVMFGGPGVHMKRLRDMTVDKVVSKTVLAKYMERMIEEWRDMTLYGTVLLGANVSFLTIQSVDEAGKDDNRTPSQRASYFSILASMGTIASSFILLGRQREVMSHIFLADRSNSRWGLESLALMYGMPFSLAIWSIISFFLSFAILWFDNKDYVVIGLAIPFTLLFSLFLVWAILVPYERNPYQFFVSQAANSQAAEGVRTAGRKIQEVSVRAVNSMKKRLLSCGGGGKGTPPRSTQSLPPSSLTEVIGSAPRPSFVSSTYKRAFPPYTHKKRWSESPTLTVEGDGEPPEKESLDISQRWETLRNDEEKVTWAGKGVSFHSPV